MTMSPYAALHALIYEVRERDLTVVQIRVTADAIPGSMTATMLAPERLNDIGTQGTQLEGRDSPDVLADPAAQERWREIVIHPDDWRDLLAGPDMRHALSMAAPEGEPNRIYGIRIAR